MYLYIIYSTNDKKKFVATVVVVVLYFVSIYVLCLRVCVCASRTPSYYLLMSFLRHTRDEQSTTKKREREKKKAYIDNIN